MYERFTDRARKVMQHANQEAQRFNHEYIGTEHVLLGLLKEGNGVGCFALEHLKVDAGLLRSNIERQMKSSPDLVTMGKLPQTPRAKKVIEYAMEEARKLAHNHVGTEHILLGLIREAEGLAGLGLAAAGVTYESAVAAIRAATDRPPKSDQERSLIAALNKIADRLDDLTDSVREAVEKLAS